MNAILALLLQGLLISISPDAVSRSETSPSPILNEHKTCSVMQATAAEIKPINATVEVFLRRTDDNRVEIVGFNSSLPFMDGILKERLAAINLPSASIDTLDQREFSVIIPLEVII